MGGGNSVRKRKLPETDSQTPPPSSQRYDLNVFNKSTNKCLKMQSSEAQLSSVHQTVGCVSQASSNVIAAPKLCNLPACSREDFASPNNIFTGATDQAEAIDFQSTPVEKNFQGKVGAMASEYSWYDFNFQQHNQTGAQLTPCRLARSTNPIYNNGMVVERNHLQCTREFVAHEQQPLVTPYQNGQYIYQYSPGFPDAANSMSSFNYGC